MNKELKKEKEGVLAESDIIKKETWSLYLFYYTHPQCIHKQCYFPVTDAHRCAIPPCSIYLEVGRILF